MGASDRPSEFTDVQKSRLSHPPNPTRAKTHSLPERGRGEVNTEGVPTFHPPGPEPAKTGSFPGYVEDSNEPRIRLRVLRMKRLP